MTHPKPSNSSFRYFLAGLKPLINIKVWGSVGLIGLVTLSIWQYSRHPEWLGADTPPPQSVDGEFEAEVGNSLDVGVTLQDIQNNNNINQSPILQNTPPIEGNIFENPLQTGQTENSKLGSPNSLPKNFKNQGKKPAVGFEPLIPSFKDLGSLFPPLAPSKKAGRPIKIPDKVVDTPQPQNNPLKDALDNMEAPPKLPVEPSSIENNQPSSFPIRPEQPNYPTTRTPRSNTYPNSNYTQPNNPTTFPNNSPQTTQPIYPNNQPYNPQPYSYPYDNGTVPNAIPANPSSRNPNPSSPNLNNQKPQQNNYGIQPPQVSGNDRAGYY